MSSRRSCKVVIESWLHFCRGKKGGPQILTDEGGFNLHSSAGSAAYGLYHIGQQLSFKYCNLSVDDSEKI